MLILLIFIDKKIVFLNNHKLEIFNQGPNWKLDNYGGWFEWETNTFDASIKIPVAKHFQKIDLIDFSRWSNSVTTGMISLSKVLIENYPFAEGESKNKTFVFINAADLW